MMMLPLLVVLAADKSDTKVQVDSVTVNGEKTQGSVSGAAATTGTAGQSWSVITARTLGKGGNALEGSVGYPGLTASLMHGMSADLDLGGRIGMNYGWEGMVSTVYPGIKLQGVARYKFLDNGRINLGASFAPGLMFYFPPRVTYVGFAVPFALTLGIIASSALHVGVGFELPMWILFGPRASVVFPVLMGAGIEYFLTSTLLLFFDLRMGPSIWTNTDASPNGAGAVFTFYGKLGIGWRF